MIALRHTALFTGRNLMVLWRQPWWIAVSLVQPVIWLLLFGALFERVVDIPGFEAASYTDFIAPGVVVMTALFSGGWVGMGMLTDIDRGVADRLLVSPVRRGALIWGYLAQDAVTIVIQSVIIVGLALADGAAFSGGVGGVAILILASVLLASGVGALSLALGLVVRREESLIATVQFFILPLTFLSVAFMPEALMPDWMGVVGDVNPVNWAIEAGREATTAGTDWAIVASRTGFLAAFALAAAWVATRAFRAYQKAV
jgi:ABC-2 type transport system permease protein